MTATPRLQLPELAAAQAQKHVTLNEALVQLDGLIGLYVISNALAAPPGMPADGDAYVIAASPSGVWTGQTGNIAVASDGAWNFYPPVRGLVAYAASASDFLVYTGSAWASLASLMALQNLSELDINTSADSTNRLAVKTNAALFADIDISAGGTGDIRAILSKQASSNTASFLFQDAFSGRAEIGLAGDDDFHFKVSPDGSAWTDALRLSASNGFVGIGGAAQALFHIHSAANPLTSGTASSSDKAVLSTESNSNVHFVAASDTASSRYNILAHCARGTFAALAAVQANDKLFGFIGGGFDGAAYQNPALIEFICDGTPTSGHVPVRISFTTGTNSSDRLERVVVLSTGFVGVNCTPAVQFDVNGPVRVGQYTVATAPAASAGAGQIIFVSDEMGGAVLAYSDGANWLRVTDRAVIS